MKREVEMKQMHFLALPLLLTFILACVTGQSSVAGDKLRNWCLDSKYHKSRPGPEGSLYGECSPWKNKACCTQNTTEKLHLDQFSLYNFDFDHCAERKKMSLECKRRFKQDHCFYECSPNVGPWMVQESRSWRKERYYKVPLCARDCEAWFKDCQDDYTCTDNWSKNFDWIKKEDCGRGQSCKINICPSGARCQTFFEIYKTAQNFCQKVWDDAWEYTPEDSPCMQMWFNGSLGNPNEKVTEWKLSNIPSLSRSEKINESLLMILWMFAFLLFL